MNTNFIWKSHPRYLYLGFQGEEAVQLKITCPDQSNVSGYSTTLPPSRTVTAIVTATTTTVVSEGSDSGLATTVATTTVNSARSSIGVTTNLGDEKALGETFMIFRVSLSRNFLLEFIS